MEERKELVETMSPAEYFEKVKNAKNVNTDESLIEFYNASLALMKKYKMFKQKKMMRKLMFIVDCIPKEQELLKLGINTFIYKDDIEEFINSVEGKAVKIIEMENYPRDIPEELGPIVEATIDIFDEFYILFTDYNGREEKKIAKERREKDPILLGAFKKSSTMNDRFYYLGDWVDEYCDLTLEKLLQEAGPEIIRNIKIPEDKKALIDECNELIENGTSYKFSNFGTIDNPHFITTSSTNAPSVTVINTNLVEATNEDNGDEA